LNEPELEKVEEAPLEVKVINQPQPVPEGPEVFIDDWSTELQKAQEESVKEDFDIGDDT
jgi:hypothetical protein